MKFILFLLLTQLCACSVGERTTYLKKYGTGQTIRTKNSQGNTVLTRVIHGHIFSKCIFQNGKLIAEDQFREDGSLVGQLVQSEDGEVVDDKLFHDNGKLSYHVVRKNERNILHEEWDEQGRLVFHLEKN